ncbi:TetR/AcrR family transcriptional regulator [Streptomyces sp. S6]
MGLREVKKQQTRTAIADAALPLFLEHGFDQVTVAEVARHAGVSTNTVFNYFPAKEDLVFDRQTEVENHLAALVRGRAPGTCPIEAVRDDLLSALRQDHPMLGLQPGAPAFWQVVEDSPALRAREREIGERIEAALANALTEHPPNTAATPGDTGHALPVLVAGAIAGAHRAALRELRRRIMSGNPPAPARDAVASAALQAFDLLCSGFHADGERACQEPRFP